MILVLSGTSDGNALIKELRQRGLPVLATAVTSYGALLAGEAGAAAIEGRQDAAGLADLARRSGAQAFVDATHPFAQQASRNARQAAASLGISYYRLSRPSSTLPSSPLLHQVESWKEAAQLAGRLGEVIFLAVGSGPLAYFKTSPSLVEKRLVARVLPALESLSRCLELGFLPRDIVAAQGPFSLSWNKAMLEHFGAQVMVTKESGPQGGTMEKIEAALSLNLHVIIAARPTDAGALGAPAILDCLSRQFGLEGGK